MGSQLPPRPEYAHKNHERRLAANCKNSTHNQKRPLMGPLANAGFQLTYFDEDGNTTVNTDEVARVGIRIVGQTLAPVRGPNGLARAQDQLETAVALRNNNRGD